MTEPRDPSPAPEAPEGQEAQGLCPSCLNVRVIHSSKGSLFYFCEVAKTDPRFSKYPPQPVRACFGYEPRELRPLGDPVD